jgi:hypothetical protein
MPRLFFGHRLFAPARPVNIFSPRYSFVKEIGESFGGLRRKL